MKRLLLPLCFSGLLFSGLLSAQSNVPVFTVTAPDLSAVQAEDEERNKQGMMYRIGVTIPVQLDIHETGEWFSDGNGNLVYHVKIYSAGALGLNLSFDQFTLPEKAELRVYNPETNMIMGPYTSVNNEEDGIMSTAIVKGDYVILEVAVPKDAVGDLKLHVNEIGYFYRQVDPFETQDTRALGDSDPCEVNVNCSEGTSWTDENRGVARVLVKDGGWGYCSGSLVNNTAGDCTPYFLLAQHCGAGAPASDFRQWVFYFKYEGPSCSDPASEPTSSNVTGCVRVAASGTASTVTKSDFLLVILKGRPVAAANAYYNGWSRSTSASTSGVGIHHPAGDIKKISTYSSTLASTTWDGTPNSHWRVYWVATTNGHGVTEGGSSGSPIFNSAGLIVGDLSGGASYCTSPNSPDSYGKFSYSWSSCGSTPQLKMEPWLDRGAVGSTTLTGLNNSTCAAGTLPVVEFNASNIYPLVSTEIVTLTDVTTNAPFYWQWYITPATYSYTGGTNAYSQNPQVTFSATGNYTVTLYAANTAGYNYKTKSAYIHVGGIGFEEEEENPIVMYPNPAKDILYVNLGNNIWDIDHTTISMMDMTGKYVLVQQMIGAGANTVSVNIPENIANGFYMVRITDGKNTKTEKLEVFK